MGVNLNVRVPLVSPALCTTDCLSWQIDVNESPELKKALGVRSVPTVKLHAGSLGQVANFTCGPRKVGNSSILFCIVDWTSTYARNVGIYFPAAILVVSSTDFRAAVRARLRCAAVLLALDTTLQSVAGIAVEVLRLLRRGRRFEKLFGNFALELFHVRIIHVTCTTRGVPGMLQ